MNQDNEQLDFLENHCYKLNRILLSIVKLWPYDRETIFTKVLRVFILTVILSLACVQLTSFYTFKFNTELLIMVLSFILPILLTVIEYYLFYIKLDKVKQIWKFISDDYNGLEDQTERKIVEHYSGIATQTTIYLIVLIVIGMIAYIFFELSPIILDIVLPLKESRPRNLIAITEYFVNIEVYFYPILCHWMFGTFVTGTVLLAIAMFHTMCIYHICGLFKTGCYRIQHSLDNYASLNEQTNDRVVVQRIGNTVHIYREATKHFDFWISGFMSSMTIAMMIVLASLSLTLFRLFNSITKFDMGDMQRSMREISTSIMMIILFFLVIFLGNNYPQKIIDHHNEIFNTVCNIRWYKTPIKIQKLLLFIMAKTTKTYAVNVSYMFTASLENFTKVASMPISYFTVLYSVTN